jgi:glycosyltransferase involved in cell wall biosynthesis
MFSDSSYYSKVVASSRGFPITFVDWQDDVSKIYSDLDLLVVPSSAVEATTRVIPEAFSARVPVIAFPAGGIPEVLDDNKTGFLAATIGVEALAERIKSVLQMDRAKLDAVTKRARNEWDRQFSLRTYQRNVCDVLARAMRPYSPYQEGQFATQQHC